MIKFINSLISLAKSNPASAVFFLVLIICPLIGTSIVTLILQSSEVEILKHASFSKIISIYILCGFLMAFGLTPTTVIAYASGFIWGWEAVPFMIVAYGIAQWIGYKTAKWAGADQLLSNILEMEYYQSQLLIMNAIKNQWTLVFFCRLSPVLPFGIMNYVLSVMQMKLKPFLIAGLLGMLPRTLFFIWIGIESETLISMPTSDWLQKGFWIFISAISIFIVMKILTGKLKKSVIVSQNNEIS